ncbi:MAG: hypothetical protein ACW986_09150 [Promethearchaeota archaeon]|jgi:hypothetical protein
MPGDRVDIEDLESFIDGLQTSFDTLGDVDPNQAKDFQAKIARTISDLRVKRAAKIEPLPKHIGTFTKEDLKIELLKELETLQNDLETFTYSVTSKIALVRKIVKLRARVNSL